MAKQAIALDFRLGIDTKTDPFQLQPGQFLSLENSVFSTGKLLSKRDGYGLFSSSSQVSSYLTTLNGNLLAIGSGVNAYSSSLNQFITKGVLEPCSLSVLPLIRNNLNQTQLDSVVANGMVLTTYTQILGSNTETASSYYFAILDAVTGQNIVPPSSIPVISGGVISTPSRCFVVGNFFVLCNAVNVSGTSYLQFCSIPLTNPVNVSTNVANVSAAQKVYSSAYVVPGGTAPGWDGVVSSNTNGTLIIAYNTQTGGQSVIVVTLGQSAIASNSSTSTHYSFTNSAYIGGAMSVCIDTTSSPQIVYVSFWNPSTGNIYIAAVYISFAAITLQFSPVNPGGSLLIDNQTSAAANGNCTLFFEETGFYTFNTSIQTNAVFYQNVTSSGTLTTSGTTALGIGLASKAFQVSGTAYFLAAYSSPYQPSYFLINGSLSTSASPVVVASLAYQNGGGYVSGTLPSVSVSGNEASIAYLYKDDVEALNTAENPQQSSTGGIYSQTGINLVTFTLGTEKIASAEIGQNLFLSGGFLGQFDGYLPVENNFFLFPDYVTTSGFTTINETPTGTLTYGSNVITSVSSTMSIFPGMLITGTGVPANTYVVSANSSTIVMTHAATGTHSSESLTISANMAAVPTGGTEGATNYYYIATYEWTDSQGLAYRSTPSIAIGLTTTGTSTIGATTIYVPTLRLTYKTANTVKIVIYRWSENTQVYNQVTSITAPLLNDPTVNYVTFVDVYNDSQIIGNNILYTTGGVVPDSGAPSTSIMTLFDTRLWIVDAENPNLLWVSKTVIQGTPVEMSPDFTIFVPSNIGTSSSTGPITALAPMDDKLIIFKDQEILYINGVGPNNLGTTSVGSPLGSYSQPTFVTSVVGCTNQQSIVLTQDGLMFQSDKGIWLLNRSLQTSYIGAAVEAYNSQTVTSSQVIPETNYVLFTLSSGGMLMYDYYYQQWGTFTGISAISSCIYNGLHTILSPQGEVLRSTPGLYLDNGNPVLISFTTSWINLASLQGYERFYGFYLLGQFLSPHNLVCGVAYDYNPSVSANTIIEPKNFSSSIPSPFGVPTPFGSMGSKEQWRVHSKQQLCESFSITLQEVFNPLYGTVGGAGFTMSGVTLEVGIKKATRPIPAKTTSGMSS